MGYNEKLLGVGLILCPFNRVILVDSPLESMTNSLATGLFSNSTYRHKFQLVEQALSPTIKWLVTSVGFMPLYAPVDMS